MSNLGTILPTKKSLAINDDYAKTMRQDKAKVGKFLKGTKKVVGGEVRYYTSNSEYSIVSSTMKVLRFEVRADGDYAVK